MAVKNSTLNCLVSRQWEWAVTGYTPITDETKTVQKSVTKYTSWVYRGMYGEWVSTGSWDSPSGGSDYSGSYPPTPSYSANDGDTTTTSGSGTAWFTEQVQTGGDPIYGWVGYGITHNHPSTVSYDDGVYAGTLNFVSCSGSPPAPSHSGTSGELATTNGNGMASYSGDVPLKPNARPQNFAWTIAKTTTTDPTLSVAEWNGLLDRINEFRKYKGLTEITTFIRASSDNTLTAQQFNQAVDIINTLSPPTAPPATVEKDSIMYAHQLNGLVTSLNSIS